VGLVPTLVRMAAAGGGCASSSGWQQQAYGSGGYGAAAGGGPGASGKDGATGDAYYSSATPGGAGSPAGAAAGGGGALGLGGPPSHTGSSAELTRLRVKAAGFVAQLCFARETTLQMLIACGGLRCLVVMVQDNLHDPSTLTLTAVACIWRVLETCGALPLNYTCRIFASAGLIPRLYAVIKQLIALSRQQRGGCGGGGAYGVVGGVGGVAGGLKLHHLHSPSSPSVFGNNAFIPLGSIAIGQAAMSAAAAAADGSGDAAAAAAARGMTIPGGKGASSSSSSSKAVRGRGSPSHESGLAGERVVCLG
jgi:hypothetical protein